MKPERASCLVVASGNDLAGDDGAGLVLLDRLAGHPRPGWRYVVAPRCGLAILDLFQEAEAMVFLDAVTSGSPPGTLHVMSLPSPALLERDPLTGHAWGLAEAVELAAILGREVPRLTLVGIEAGSVRLGDPLSPEVARAIDDCELRFEEIVGAFGPGA